MYTGQTVSPFFCYVCDVTFVIEIILLLLVSSCWGIGLSLLIFTRQGKRVC